MLKRSKSKPFLFIRERFSIKIEQKGTNLIGSFYFTNNLIDREQIEIKYNLGNRDKENLKVNLVGLLYRIVKVLEKYLDEMERIAINITELLGGNGQKVMDPVDVKALRQIRDELLDFQDAFYDVQIIL